MNVAIHRLHSFVAARGDFGARVDNIEASRNATMMAVIAAASF